MKIIFIFHLKFKYDTYDLKNKIIITLIKSIYFQDKSHIY